MKTIRQFFRETCTDPDLLKFGEDILPESNIKARQTLKGLCENKPELETAVLVAVIGLECAKRYERLTQDLLKGAKGERKNKLRKWCNAISVLYGNGVGGGVSKQTYRIKLSEKLSRDNQLIEKFRKISSRPYPKHKEIKNLIIDSIQNNTSNKPNRTHDRLARLLNELGFTTLFDKPYSRQNISKQ